MSVTKQTIGIYWQHLRKQRGLFVLLIVMTAAGMISQQFIGPLLIAQILDMLSNSGASDVNIWQTYGPVILLFAATELFSIIVWRAMLWLLWDLESDVLKQLSERCFRYLLRQNYGFHQNRFGGALVSQSNKFVAAFERITDEFFFSIITILAAYAATFIILFPRVPIFVLVFGALSLVYLVLIFVRFRKQHPYNVAEAQAESRQTAQLADSITNVTTIQAFAQAELEDSIYDKFTSKTRAATLRLRRVATLNDIYFSSLNSFMTIASLLISIVAVTRFNAPLGTLYLVISYTNNLLRRLWELNRVARNLTKAFGDANDMTVILSNPEEISEISESPSSLVLRGGIRFEDVTYSYPEQNVDKALFENFNLSIKPGEKIGLVGHSGSGKTTLTKLLLRFMDIDSGVISIDTHDITKLTLKDLRSRIAYVPQEPMMFHRSLMDNIRYGQLDASDEAVKAVAKMAHVAEFIEKLPKGYETLVGERGTKLSGGQRQRVAIARAMLKNAPILLLDEATSALDSESEQLIQDALWKLMEGRTAIVIAHRLSTIQKMDRIVVLDEGKIVEQGSHRELIKQGGVYASLWSHQSGGFIDE